MDLACSSNGCYNRQSEDSSVTFHKFPLQEPLLLRFWLKAMGRKHFYPSKHHVLCSEHFTSDCFKPPGSKYKQLKDWSVPTIFPRIGKKQIGKVRKKQCDSITLKLNPLDFLSVEMEPDDSEELQNSKNDDGCAKSIVTQRTNPSCVSLPTKSNIKEEALQEPRKFGVILVKVDTNKSEPSETNANKDESLENSHKQIVLLCTSINLRKRASDNTGTNNAQNSESECAKEGKLGRLEIEHSLVEHIPRDSCKEDAILGL